MYGNYHEKDELSHSFVEVAPDSLIEKVINTNTSRANYSGGVAESEILINDDVRYLQYNNSRDNICYVLWIQVFAVFGATAIGFINFYCSNVFKDIYGGT